MAYKDVLSAYLAKLEAVDPVLDREQFTAFLVEGMNLLAITQVDLMSRFSMSRPSASRWMNGKTVPHRALRPSVVAFLRQKAKNQLVAVKRVESAVTLDASTSCVDA